MPRMWPIQVTLSGEYGVKYSTFVSKGTLSEFQGMGKPLVPVATCDMNCVGVVKWHKNLSLTMFGCDDGSVHISDGNSFVSFKGHDEGHVGSVYDGMFSNDGSILYSISKLDPRILRWDLESEVRQPMVMQGSKANPLDLYGFVAITLDEERAEVIALRLIEVASSGTLVVVFGMHNGQVLREYKGLGSYYRIEAAVITQTNPTCIIYTGEQTNILYSDVMINQVNVDGSHDLILQTRSHLQLARGYIQCMALSADNTKLAVGTSLASVLLFTVSTDKNCQILQKFRTYFGHWLTGVVSPDEQRKQCSCATDTALQKCSLVSHRVVVYNVEFDSSDKRVISFGNGYVLERNASQDSDADANIVERWVPFKTTTEYRGYGGIQEAPKRRVVFRVPNYMEFVKIRTAKLEAAAMAMVPRLGTASLLGDIEPNLLIMIADFV
ncbi:hypothetical protein T484DRAFT_1757858 [Baffinella frigidus]|nr:hypothetical protein T484DRAFT_1757858 [Cryptophyta sp. CCMP2293]